MKDGKSMLNDRIGGRIRKGYNLVSMPTIDLNEPEADQFITYIFDSSVLQNFARIERMNGPMKPIRAMGYGNGQFLYPAARFNEAKYKKEFADNKITLQTQECRGAIFVADSDLEDLPKSVTEAQWMDNLMRLIGSKIKNELELAAWMSDTAGLQWGAERIESLWDGWRYRITHSAANQAHYNKITGSAIILNACEAGTSGEDMQFPGEIAEQNPAAPYNWEFKYAWMLKLMPWQYKQQYGLANMAFLNSDLVTADYLMAISSRSTGLGDSVFTGQVTPQYGGVKILDAPAMPTNLGDPTANPSTDGIIGGGDYTDVLMTYKGNLVIGIQRDIKIEAQREAADQGTYIFYSLRMCFAIENVNACVLLRCLEHGC